MATQQEIQSLLQSLTGMQSNIQGALPFTSNNGNPNTVYNLSAPNVKQFNPATGNLPAMGDAAGNWAVPATGVGGIDPNLLALLQQLVVGRTPITPTVPPLQLNPLTPSNPGAGGTPPPVAPPPDQNTINQVLKDLGDYGGGGGGGMGGGAMPGGLYGVGANTNFGTGGVSGNTGSSANSGGFYSPATGLWGAAPGLANQLGMNANGTMDWQQGLDLFLPGNLYNSQTHEWNQGGIVGALAEQLFGLPGISNIINKIGEKATTDANPNNDNNWFARQFLNSVTNRAQGLSNQIGAQALNKFAKVNNPIMKELLNKQAEENTKEETARLQAEADAKAQAAIEAAVGDYEPGEGGGRGIGGRANTNSQFLGRSGGGGTKTGTVNVGDPVKVVKASQ